MAVFAAAQHDPCDRFFYLVEHSQYDQAWDYLQIQRGVHGNGVFSDDCMRITLKRADDLLREGNLSPIKNKTPWVLEALRCRNLALSIFNSSDPLLFKYSNVGYILNALSDRLGASPFYALADEQLNITIAEAHAAQVQEDPQPDAVDEVQTVFGFDKEMHVEFKQKTPTCVEVFVAQLGANNQADGRAGGSDPNRGSNHVLQFTGKLTEVSFEKRNEIFELISLLYAIGMHNVQPSYMKTYLSQFNCMFPENVDMFIGMLKHLIMR